MADVGEGVLGFDPLAELGAPGGSLLALAQFGQQRLVWMGWQRCARCCWRCSGPAAASSAARTNADFHASDSAQLTGERAASHLILFPADEPANLEALTVTVTGHQ